MFSLTLKYLQVRHHFTVPLQAPVAQFSADIFDFLFLITNYHILNTVVSPNSHTNWPHENVSIWVREGFQKNNKLDFLASILSRRANHFLLLGNFCSSISGINFLFRKYFSNYKQKSNFNTRIDTLDAKSSRYPISHIVPKQSHIPK